MLSHPVCGDLLEMPQGTSAPPITGVREAMPGLPLSRAPLGVGSPCRAGARQGRAGQAARSPEPPRGQANTTASAQLRAWLPPLGRGFAGLWVCGVQYAGFWPAAAGKGVEAEGEQLVLIYFSAYPRGSAFSSRKVFPLSLSFSGAGGALGVVGRLQRVQTAWATQLPAPAGPGAELRQVLWEVGHLQEVGRVPASGASPAAPLLP